MSFARNISKVIDLKNDSKKMRNYYQANVNRKDQSKIHLLNKTQFQNTIITQSKGPLYNKKRHNF